MAQEPTRSKTDDGGRQVVDFPTCHAPVQRPLFVATTWESTCECNGTGSQWSHGSCACTHGPPKPASAYPYGKPAWQQTTNFTCECSKRSAWAVAVAAALTVDCQTKRCLLLRTGWHYPNIETLGHISSELYRGNCTGRSGACIGQSDPGDWHDAAYSLNFGTWANR